MRINDIIYFSPSLKLEDFDLDDKEVVLKYFDERITEYYIKPISSLLQGEQAFAAGALQCLLIDALSRYSSEEDGVGKRIKSWCVKNLAISEPVAASFYEFFRCGLLHESHIKQFGQFCFDEIFARPIVDHGGFVIVNPKYLHEAIKSFFKSFIEDLRTNEELFQIFRDRLESDFGAEVIRARE